MDTIYRADGITFEEINEKWLRNSMSDGLDLPLKTFHNHRKAIEATGGTDTGIMSRTRKT